jgi:hypothetical protein
MYKAFLTAATTALIGMAGTATAVPLSWTFTANGVTDSFSQQGTAVFTWADVNNPNSFTLTLTDNVSPTANILSELDGLSFGFSQAPTTITLTSITPTSVIDCTNSTSPCPSGSGSSPYGWGTTYDGGGVNLGAGFDGTSAFAYQPFGIVNANYTSPGDGSGLSGAENNPLLVGPVTFTFTTTGLSSIPMINGVSFDFGDPIVVAAVPAAVPEPAPLALLGIGLVAGWLGRRRSKD